MSRTRVPLPVAVTNAFARHRSPCRSVSGPPASFRTCALRGASVSAWYSRSSRRSRTAIVSADGWTAARGSASRPRMASATFDMKKDKPRSLLWWRTSASGAYVQLGHQFDSRLDARTFRASVEGLVAEILIDLPHPAALPLRRRGQQRRTAVAQPDGREPTFGDQSVE